MKGLLNSLLGQTTIRTRLLVLLAVQALILAVIAAVAILGLRASSKSMNELNQDVSDQVQIKLLGDQIRDQLGSAVNGLRSGTLEWSDGQSLISGISTEFDELWNRYRRGLSEQQQEYVDDLHASSLADVRKAFARLTELTLQRNEQTLQTFLDKDYGPLVEPYFDMLQARAARQQSKADDNYREAKTANRNAINGTLIAVLLGLALAIGIGLLIYASIVGPLGRISQTVSKLRDGDYSSRSELTTPDEVGELGQSFDILLDERVQALANAEAENARLNEAIAEILSAVYSLSKERDLTVAVPVTEGITGAISDSLNLLRDHFSSVLRDVVKIAEEVSSSSHNLKEHSEKVQKLAAYERREVSEASSELSTAARVMGSIAELARECNETAQQTMGNTQEALIAVGDTVNGVNATRDVMREAEKRIKRLGEQSQEIGTIVNMINSLAEQTHMLALNANMQAIAAGEAGKSFALVATEVKELAQRAREATGNISALVSSIQTETSETTHVMNKAIEEVVRGTQLSEKASSRMEATRESTRLLVNAVEKIASNSLSQVELGETLKQRAATITKSTEATSGALEAQDAQTTGLVGFSRNLVQAVGVFTIPVGADNDEDNVAESRPAVQLVTQQ